MDDPNVAYGQTAAVAVEPAAMQVVALFIELLIEPPRATAARARDFLSVATPKSTPRVPP